MVCSVILAGGAGTRLWPLSDNEVPKQFLKLFSEDSMIVETSNRVLPRAPLSCQYVLTGEKYQALVQEQFDGKVNVLAEPRAKNTAPCILWAALKILKDRGKDAVMVVMPSDHAIGDAKSFIEALDTASQAAEDGSIVTFGIVPTRAEEGYGYIEIEDMDFTANRSVKKVCAFHEKPDKRHAREYLAAGNYMWNSGMFIFKAGAMIEEYKAHCKQVYDCFADIDPDNAAQVSGAFQRTPAISIDYAVMEYTKNAVCVPASFGWSDVGGYQSLHDESDKDENGNVLRGNVIAQDTTNCYVSGNRRIVCVGLDDIVVVESGHTILVAKKDRSEQIGAIAKMLASKQ